MYYLRNIMPMDLNNLFKLIKDFQIFLEKFKKGFLLIPIEIIPSREKVLFKTFIKSLKCLYQDTSKIIEYFKYLNRFFKLSEIKDKFVFEEIFTRTITFKYSLVLFISMTKQITKEEESFLIEYLEKIKSSIPIIPSAEERTKRWYIEKNLLRREKMIEKKKNSS